MCPYSENTDAVLIVGQTSLNMPGFSITLLQLPDGSNPADPSADLILSLLDERPDVPGWKWASTLPPVASGEQIKQTTGTRPAGLPPAVKLHAEDPKAFDEAVKRACDAIIAAEPEITRMDNIAGDGDCGLTLKDGANGECGCYGGHTVRDSEAVGYRCPEGVAERHSHGPGRRRLGDCSLQGRRGADGRDQRSAVLVRTYKAQTPRFPRVLRRTPAGSSSPRSRRVCRHTTTTQTR